MLERAKSSILPNENFRGFFLWRGDFAFSKREFPVALISGIFYSPVKIRDRWAKCLSLTVGQSSAFQVNVSDYFLIRFYSVSKPHRDKCDCGRKLMLNFGLFAPPPVKTRKGWVKYLSHFFRAIHRTQWPLIYFGWDAAVLSRRLKSGGLIIRLCYSTLSRTKI